MIKRKGWNHIFGTTEWEKYKGNGINALRVVDEYPKFWGWIPVLLGISGRNLYKAIFHK